MQDDIILKKPPVVANSENTEPASQQPEQGTPEPPAQTTEAIAEKATPVSNSNAPVTAIVLAVFICIFLISAAVYGTISQ